MLFPLYNTNFCSNSEGIHSRNYIPHSWNTSLIGAVTFVWLNLNNRLAKQFPRITRCPLTFEELSVWNFVCFSRLHSDQLLFCQKIRLNNFETFFFKSKAEKIFWYLKEKLQIFCILSSSFCYDQCWQLWVGKFINFHFFCNIRLCALNLK